MAAMETVGVARGRLSVSMFACHLLLVSSVVTGLLTSVLITSVGFNGNSRCAGATGNRKQQRNDSLNAANISTTGYRRFIVNNVHLCDAVVDDDGITSRPVYVVTVHSRPGQRGRMQRDAIRLTWGSSLHRRVAEPDMRLVFMLGRDRKCEGVASSCWQAVRRESRLYRDVIVADFVDTYRSLTLKSLSGLTWARRHCRSARYIVKVDDDVYMRPELLQRVQQLTSGSWNSVIVGSLNVNSSVQRRGLWRVDERAFPAPTFPPYCSGNVYAMTSSLADRLLEVAESDRNSTPFPLEDVYITSQLATSVGAQCVHDDAFPRWDVGPSRVNVERLRNESLLAIHNVHCTQMYDVMRRIHNDR